MRKMVLLMCWMSILSCGLQAQGSIRPIGKTQGDTENRKFWYGGNTPFGIGFGPTTQIQLGIIPMIGYKLTPNFSVGPRAGFVVSYYSQRLFSGQRQSVLPLSWVAGAFTRYKFVDRFFAHAEYEYSNEAVPYNTANGLDVQRFNANNVNLGVGFLQGNSSTIRSEIMVLYNVNQGTFITRSPLSLRFGVNWYF